MQNRRIALFLVLVLALASLPMLAQNSASTSQPPSKSTMSSSPSPGTKIDINMATKAQLQTLQGIGDAYAQKIIDGRPYNTKRDLVTRHIIPESTYAAIQDKIIAHRASGAKKGSNPMTSPSSPSSH